MACVVGRLCVKSQQRSWCRAVGVFLRRFPQVRTDFPALIDEWASRFFEELDYIKEGNNGIRFSEFMAKELPQVCQHLLFAPLLCVPIC